MKYKRIRILTVLLLISLLSGCRYRTTPARLAQYAREDPVTEQQDEQRNTSQEEDEATDRDQDLNRPASELSAEADKKFEHLNPDSNRSGTNDNGNDAVTAPDSDLNPDVNPSTPSDSGDNAVIGPDGGTIGAVVDRYTELLESGTGQLYPCQMQYLYFETTENYHTVARKSQEDNVILEAGAYNCAEKRSAANLTVDDAWVISKDPGLIVKCVDDSVLGANVSDTARADEIYQAIADRPGWSNMAAVQNGKILLISDSLMQTDNGRLIAKLCIAKYLYASLFSEIDISEMCSQLLQSDGIYTYSRA